MAGPTRTLTSPFVRSRRHVPRRHVCWAHPPFAAAVPSLVIAALRPCEVCQLGGRSTVDFLDATAGWANLLEGRTRPALAHFRSVLVAVRGDLAGSRYAVEAALGAGCGLAEVGDEHAAEVLALARGWVDEAGHSLAPAMRRRLDGVSVASGAAAMMLADPRDRLLEILERYREP
jgi:hypothetical protein